MRPSAIRLLLFLAITVSMNGSRVLMLSGIWMLAVVLRAGQSEAAAETGVGSNISSDIEELELVIEEVAATGDVDDIISWADEVCRTRDFESWLPPLAKTKPENFIRRNLRFAAFGRACLFAPRDVVRFLNGFQNHENLCGGIQVVEYSLTSLVIPHQRRYWKADGRSVILGIRVQPDKLESLTAPVVFVGLNKGTHRPGDKLRIEDIDFVDTNFDLFYSMPAESVIKGGKLPPTGTPSSEPPKKPPQLPPATSPASPARPG